MSFKILLVCLALLQPTLQPAVSAETKANTLHYTNDGFSITLPPGWRELLPDQIRALRELSAEQARMPLQGIVHIYQLENAAQPQELPLVVVQVAKTGRISDRLMRKFVGTNDPHGALTRELRGLGIYDNHVRNLTFDTNRFVLKIDAIKQGEQSRDRALMKIFFTEDGSITVAGLATELDFPKWSATLDQIVDSTGIAEVIRYRLRPPPDLSSGWRDWLIVGVALVGLLVIAGGWTYWTRLRGPSTLDY